MGVCHFGSHDVLCTPHCRAATSKDVVNGACGFKGRLHTQHDVRELLPDDAGCCGVHICDAQTHEATKLRQQVARDAGRHAKLPAAKLAGAPQGIFYTAAHGLAACAQGSGYLWAKARKVPQLPLSRRGNKLPVDFGQSRTQRFAHILVCAAYLGATCRKVLEF